LTGRCIKKEVIIFVGVGIIKQLHVAGGVNIEQGLTVVGGFDADVITQNGQPVSGNVVTDSTLSGNGSAGSPLKVPAGLFGADTIVPLPNSSSTPVSAAELVTTLTNSTAGSEASKFLLKMLNGGAQQGNISFEPQQMITDSGTLASWTWLMKANGTPVCSIGYTSTGQLIFWATQVGGGLGFGVGTPGQPWGATGTILTLNPTTGLILNAALQQSQFTNVASASTTVIPPGGNGSGNRGNITGTTTINLIDCTNYILGSELLLMFSSGLTLKHNQTQSGNAVGMLLKGSVDAVVPANGRIHLVLLGSNSGAGPDHWVDFSGVISP
jgi:hypothetical protein